MKENKTVIVKLRILRMIGFNENQEEEIIVCKFSIRIKKLILKVQTG